MPLLSVVYYYKKFELHLIWDIWDGIWNHTLTKIIQGWYFTAENTPANHNPRKPDPQTIARHKIVNPKVILNIGGLKHEVFETYYDPAVENTSPNKSAF